MHVLGSIEFPKKVLFVEIWLNWMHICISRFGSQWGVFEKSYTFPLITYLRLQSYCFEYDESNNQDGLL